MGAWDAAENKPESSAPWSLGPSRKDHKQIDKHVPWFQKGIKATKNKMGEYDGGRQSAGRGH